MNAIIKKWLDRMRRTAISNEKENFLAERVELIQRRLADYLNVKAARWNQRQLIVLLGCFCLCAGGYSIFITCRAVVCANGPPVVTKPKAKTLQHQGKSAQRTLPYPQTDTNNNDQPLKK